MMQPGMLCGQPEVPDYFYFFDIQLHIFQTRCRPLRWFFDYRSSLAMASEANVKAEGLGASESFSAAPAEAAGSEKASEPTAQHDDAEAPRHDGSATAPPGVKLCGVCNTNPSKYKCPRCFMP